MSRGASGKVTGNPPIPARASRERREPWELAARQAGLTFSEWVRRTLDEKAGVGVAVGREPDQPSRTYLDPDDCPHPKDERTRRSYGSICDACGTLVAL